MNACRGTIYRGWLACGLLGCCSAIGCEQAMEVLIDWGVIKFEIDTIEGDWVELPAAEPDLVDPLPADATIELRPGRMLRLNGEELTRDALRLALVELATRQPVPQVVIAAAAETPTRDVQELIAICQDCGLERFQLKLADEP